MRKLLVCIFALLAFVGTISAQQTPQQLLDAAKKAVKNDWKKEKMADVQKLVDDALKVPENAAGAEAWLAKGRFYNSVSKLDETGRTMAQFTKKEYKNEYLKSALEAVSALKMALKNNKDPKLLKDIVKAANEAAANLNPYGSDMSDAKDYLGAYESFKAAVDMNDLVKAAGQKGTLDKPEDYLKQINLVALLSPYADKEKETVEIYKKLIEAKRDTASTYSSLYKATIETDKAAAEKYLTEGRKKFPDDAQLLFTEINFYLKEGKLDILIDKLKEGIKKEPKNSSLVFTLGSVYDNLSQSEKDPAKAEELTKSAAESYEKALEIDPKNSDAIYSIGAIYYNKAAKQSAQLKKLESDFSKEGQKKYTEAEKTMQVEFDKALPYFKRAESVNANDKNTLIALKEIYARKDDLKTSKEFKSRLEIIENGGKNPKSFFDEK